MNALTDDASKAQPILSNLDPTERSSNMQAHFRVNRQKGLSLIEAVAFLGLAAVVVVGALAIYGSAQTEQRITQTVTEFQGIRAGAKSLYQGQSYGSGSLLPTLRRNNRLPASISYTSGATTGTNSFSGVVRVRGVGSTFYVEYDRVPSEVCVGLLLALTKTKDWRGYDVQAGGTAGGTPNPPRMINGPLDIGQAEDACGVPGRDESRVTFWAR